MNFQSFNLALKETNDLVFFNSSDREFHILGPIKEKVSIPVFTLSTLGTDMIFNEDEKNFQGAFKERICLI